MTQIVDINGGAVHVDTEFDGADVVVITLHPNRFGPEVQVRLTPAMAAKLGAALADLCVDLAVEAEENDE